MTLVADNPITPIRYGAESTIPYLDPYVIQFKPAHGWTRAWTILDDHRGFKRLPQFRDWTKQDHVREMQYARDVAERIRTAYYAAYQLAETTYGDHGPLISGVGRDHFPEVVKTTLRMLIQRANYEEQRAFAHWRAAGRTRARWINERDARGAACTCGWSADDDTDHESWCPARDARRRG